VTDRINGGRLDVAVVGGGLMGATVALFLARAGLGVALIDRGSICRGASGVNAGTLTLHMTRTALIPYAMRGFELWTMAREWLGDDLGVVATGGLCLAFTEDEAALLEERTVARRAAGAPMELVGPGRAREIEPGLGGDVRLAAFCPIDGYVSAYLTGLAYRRALTAERVQLFEHRPVDAIEWETGGFRVRGRGLDLRATRIVLAGAVWLEPMLRWLGIELTIKVLVNQLAVTERLPRVMRTVITIASGLLSLKQFANGTVLVGGGWQGKGDRAHDTGTLIPENLLGNLRLAAYAVPALRAGRLVRAWLGLEAETADAMPAIGQVPGTPGAFVIGSVHSGFTSGPYMGRLLADQILGRLPERPLFPIDRLLKPAPESATEVHAR